MKLLKPWFVKTKGRNLCLCWRHLEWDFLCEALYNFRSHNRRSHRGKAAVVSKKCKFKVDRDPYRMYKTLMCPRRERTAEETGDGPVVGVDFDREPCITRACEKCRGVSRLEICAEEMAVQIHVNFMKRETVE